MDWNLFWTAFGAIGGTLGAVATTAAVVVALWQTKYSQKKIIKLGFSDNFQLYNPNTGESVKFIGISVTNIILIYIINIKLYINFNFFWKLIRII